MVKHFQYAVLNKATDGRRKDNLLGLLKYSYARDIVVVNSDGIGRFLEYRSF